MKIGFTGTKRGMTDKQKFKVQDLLKGCSEFHHGSCIGADREAGDIASILGIRIILHPPLNTQYMAPCSGNEVRTPKSYLVRDKDIVDETNFLIGTPKGFSEELRSGTWSTIRYARKADKKIIIVWPNGTITIENDKLSW